MPPTLPDRYLITPEPRSGDDARFLGALQQALDHGIRLVQLRSRQLDRQAFRELAGQTARLCAAAGATLILNPPQPGMTGGMAGGRHLTSAALMACRARPADARQLLAASCHTAAELAQAQRIGVDLVTLSPVQRTLTHPDAEPLGWDRFAALAATVSLPVFALGGMTPADLALARQHGAHGIASIRGLWPG